MSSGPDLIGAILSAVEGSPLSVVIEIKGIMVKLGNKMRYKVLEGIATADVAYQVYGKTMEELFINAATAVTQTMVDMTTVKPLLSSKFKVGALRASSNLEDLLLDFLNNLVFLKDAKQMLFSQFDVRIDKLDARGYKLDVIVWGEKIDLARHKLRCDVKAVTKHQLQIGKKHSLYIATIVLDI